MLTLFSWWALRVQATNFGGETGMTIDAIVGPRCTTG